MLLSGSFRNKYMVSMSEYDCHIKLPYLYQLLCQCVSPCLQFQLAVEVQMSHQFRTMNYNTGKHVGHSKSQLY